MKLIKNYYILVFYFYLSLQLFCNNRKIKRSSKRRRRSVQADDGNNDDVIKQSLVSIEAYSNFYLYGEIPTLDKTESNGFFIDANLIVAHKKSIYKTSTIIVQLANGSRLKGGIFYEDAFLPFVLIRINDDKLSYFENDYQMTLSDSINDYLPGEDNFVLTELVNKQLAKRIGKIISLNSNLSMRYGNLIKMSFNQENQTTFPKLGAPVLDSDGNVIGLNIVNDDEKKFNYILNIQYISNAIKQYIDLLFIGDLGISLQIINLNQAHQRFNFQLEKDYTDESNFLLVSSVIPGLNSYEKLFFGDVIINVNGTEISDNTLRMDSILNKFSNSTVDILISRNGELKNVSIPVENSQNYNIDKYLILNKNILIQDFTGKMNYDFVRDLKGIIFSMKKNPNNNIKSSLKKRMTQPNDNQNYYISYLINRINSIKINNTDDLETFFNNSCSTDNLILEGFYLKNLSPYYSVLKLQVNASFLEEKIYDYNLTSWIDSRRINQSDICVNQIIKNTTNLTKIEKNEVPKINANITNGTLPVNTTNSTNISPVNNTKNLTNGTLPVNTTNSTNIPHVNNTQNLTNVSVNKTIHVELPGNKTIPVELPVNKTIPAELQGNKTNLNYTKPKNKANQIVIEVPFYDEKTRLYVDTLLMEKEYENY